MVRPPAVAGHFYPDEKHALMHQLSSLCSPSVEAAVTVPVEFSDHQARRRAIACLVPHAGYRFSGRVAGSVYAGLELPHRFLLIGPRHYPRGQEQAILSQGFWETPLGLVEIDRNLADDLKGAYSPLVEDEVAHREEHAIEVQLPFLQYLTGEFRFVPIALGTLDYGKLEALGEAIAAVLSRYADPVLLIASSDMNHYESDEITRRKDRLALGRLQALDPRGLYDIVRREGISMCGMGPVVSMLVAARELGASTADLVRYGTSGDILPDRDEVVGYAGVVVY